MCIIFIIISIAQYGLSIGIFLGVLMCVHERVFVLSCN